VKPEAGRQPWRQQKQIRPDSPAGRPEAVATGSRLNMPVELRFSSSFSFNLIILGNGEKIFIFFDEPEKKLLAV
jgi:hypothetical protein